VFRGSYSEFVAERLKIEQAAAAQAVAAQKAQQVVRAASNGTSKNTRQLQKQIADAENRIHQLEAQMREISAAIERAGSDANKIRTLGEQYTQTEQLLNTAMAEWEALME
jgi:predicted  nucleic acid-binding Zn-ribbon protein